MDAKIAFVFLMMTTVAVKGFANAEKESVEDKVAAENELAEGEVAKKLKEFSDVREDAKREAKMLEGKRGLERIVRSEKRSVLQETEEKLEGKEKTTEAAGGSAMAGNEREAKDTEDTEDVHNAKYAKGDEAEDDQRADDDHGYASRRPRPRRGSGKRCFCQGEWT